MRLILIIVLSAITVESYSQVKSSINITGSHSESVNRIQGKAEQIKQLKKYQEAHAAYKRRFERLKQKIDSGAFQDSVLLTLNEVRIWNEQDSLKVAQRVLEEGKLPSEYVALLNNPPKLGSDTIPILNYDSTWVQNSIAKFEESLETRAKAFLPKELQQPIQDPLSEVPINPLDDSIGTTEFEKLNPNVVEPKVAQDLFQKVGAQEFQDLQNNIGKLKKKYTTIPDVRFPKSGIKRNSLGDKKFSERVFLGGTFNLTSTEPLILDGALQLGYWINKKWMTGLSISMREQFNHRDSTALTGDAHGYSLLTRYNLVKSFYAWAELERKINRSLFNKPLTERANKEYWQESYLLGLGRDFKVGPVLISSIIMYDFNYRQNNLHKSLFIIRMGFRAL